MGQELFRRILCLANLDTETSRRKKDIDKNASELFWKADMDKTR